MAMAQGRPDFIERLSAMLVELGVPRMPSRAFATLIATDDGYLTAAELAEALQASPAAISGAMRYLSQVGLVSRIREPGTRRDVFHVDGDLWYESMFRRDPILHRFVHTMREGVAQVGPNTPAGRRLTETTAFFEFLLDELAQTMDRWKIRREELRAQNAERALEP
jgi:DNA-binding transcriptional regulator GbsR (MarR family)